MKINSFHFFKSVFFIYLLTFAYTSQAKTDCENFVGRFTSVQGLVDTQITTGKKWIPANLNIQLCQGSTIRVGENSRATVSLINDAVLRLDQNTTMHLTNITPEEKEQSFLDVIKGAFHSFSRKPKLLTFSSPYLNGSIEGTEYVVRVENGQTNLTVFEGTVIASNDYGTLSVAMGQSVTALKGQAPQLRILINPRDEVQWGLYFPKIILTDDSAADDQILNAAALLEVGRIAEAKKILDPIKDNGLAHALRAIVQVALNNPDQALTEALKGVEKTPSAATSLALSYAQQASLDLKAARATMQAASQSYPNNALVLSRLSELTLMLGDRKSALTLAQQAATKDPNLGHAQVVLGFAALAVYDSTAAKDAFGKALQLESANPLAHLGMGLAKINSGKLSEGRQHIEVAVAMDSNDAIIRAYLGKSYFEENRDNLAVEQYNIAKALDPNDPTAYLYDGILKQTNNDPFGALTDIEKSIELNDNRAVYRSRLLLDQDRAARGTSLARTYKDLGFSGLAVREASRSLQYDPANASAHRFLSDSYLGGRRTEIARVSALLQAQMLQDVNLNPIQPSISQTNLNMVSLGGPAQAGFNEFNALFQKNQIQGNVNLLAGDNSTKSGELSATAVLNNFSWSFGAMTYDTDGWRDNNELDQDLVNVFGQYAINENLNIQVEYSERDSTEGDLAFDFDPDSFSPTESREIDQKVTRLGLRFNPTINSVILLSYIDNDSEEIYSDTFFLPFNPEFEGATDIINSSSQDDEGEQYELQYIYNNDNYNVVAGVSQSDNDRLLTTGVTINILDGPAAPLGSVDFNFTEKEKIDHPHAYFYFNHNLTDTLNYTIGMSYDDYEEEVAQGDIDVSESNVKFGVSYQFNESVLFRAAAFQTVKPLLVNSRTLEPTQIAGFNQFYDDPNGTEADKYGLGLDWKFNSSFTMTLEFTSRSLDVPVVDGLNSTILYEDQDELHHELSFNWIVSSNLSVTAGLVYDDFESDDGVLTSFDAVPLDVETYTVPIAANYFHSNGTFAGAKISFVDQEVNKTLAGKDSDEFTVVDVVIGYRMKNRRGQISLGITNLFDEEFSYQDDSYREASYAATTGPYFPERVVMGQMSFNF